MMRTTRNNGIGTEKIPTRRDIGVKFRDGNTEYPLFLFLSFNYKEACLQVLWLHFRSFDSDHSH